jgi:molybdopterin molybdotransferase
MAAPTELGPSPLAQGDSQISVDEARVRIAASLSAIGGLERLPVPQALGRVLAEEVISPIDVPAHDNSAMDGFAFRGAELQAAVESSFRVAGAVMAGDAAPPAIAPGECLRIMTGAVMPPGLDTVVPLELCREEGGVVRIAAGTVQPGENRRPRGEDLARGKPALARGRVLRPADLGLAASLGLTELPVVPRLKVALFSTGNELREAGQPLDAGCIYDSNRHSLAAALRRMGVVEVVDLGLVRDEPAALQATLERALREADVVLTSGGVSMGDADYTRDLLSRHGEVAFWKVAMRPGRPFAFGPLRRLAGVGPAWLFALPGNPVAALVTFYAFAQDALWQLAGASRAPAPRLQARSAVPLRKRPGRTEFQRAIVEPATDGSGWQVRPTGSQGAGILRSMSEANALLVLGHEQGSVAAGEMVEVWLFDGIV